MPPQLFLFALAGAGLWAGYKWYRKESARIQSELREAEEQLARRAEKAVPRLKRDPKTGVYTPDEE